MFALVDCNSFFCSVEKVFHPGLEGKPVCVLSNNDGCIVALTPECKKIGLHRGEPIFKVKDIVEKHDVKVFSTNMMLYAAMSKRIVSILRKQIAKVENYSIDESFCYLDGYERYHDLTELMRSVAGKIKLYTDIPVSVGIAPTKTLAKIGSKYAKQYAGYRGVCAIDSEEKRLKALGAFPLDDVWGVGRQTLRRLNALGVATTLEFASKPEGWVRRHFTKPGVQTWLELNGHPCIDTHEPTLNKSLCTSRSFGSMIRDFDSLKASVLSFASSCASKLRGQGAGCREVTVFIGSNPFREDHEQYFNSATRRLTTATADTLEIAHAAVEALTSIYNPAIWYKRSGVVVSDISHMSVVEQHLFDPISRRPERARLMRAIDDINARYGLKTLHLGAETEGRQLWGVKCEHRSGNYLSDIDEILAVRI